MTPDEDEPTKQSRRAFIKASSVVGGTALASPLLAEEPRVGTANPWLTVRPRSEDIDPWMMPPHFGMPAWQRLDGVPPGDSLYDDVTLISIDYLTDRDKLEKYLPRPYELDGSPVVTVAYSMNRDISWLAGGSYNIISVSTRATYPGEVDQISGSYALVLWENLTEPILPGREQLGIPKVFGHIDDHREFKGAWRTTLSNNGKTMLEMNATELSELAANDLTAYRERNEQVNVMGWKYISDETRSAPILSYATVVPFTYKYREVWSAKGSLTWFAREWQELPTQAHIVNALHGLPIKEVLNCTVSKASLILRTSQVRRLA